MKITLQGVESGYPVPAVSAPYELVGLWMEMDFHDVESVDLYIRHIDDIVAGRAPTGQDDFEWWGDAHEVHFEADGVRIKGIYQDRSCKVPYEEMRDGLLQWRASWTSAPPPPERR